MNKIEGKSKDQDSSASISRRFLQPFYDLVKKENELIKNLNENILQEYMQFQDTYKTFLLLHKGFNAETQGMLKIMQQNLEKRKQEKLNKQTEKKVGKTGYIGKVKPNETQVTKRHNQTQKSVSYQNQKAKPKLVMTNLRKQASILQKIEWQIQNRKCFSLEQSVQNSLFMPYEVIQKMLDYNYSQIYPLIPGEKLRRKITQG